MLRSFLWAYKHVTASLEAAFARAGAASLIEAVVLTQLHRAPRGRLPLQALGRGLPYITKSGVTRLIDRMQAAGLVERQESREDRRVTYAAITPRGRNELRFAASVFREAYAATFAAALGLDEIEALVGLLDRLRAAATPARGDVRSPEAEDFLAAQEEEPFDIQAPLSVLEAWRQDLDEALLGSPASGP